ncbi:MAG: MCE family protein, partial [Acetobacteraceae bacterium]|nr:MCE family protein [Acetobacteraceae bacterium]
MESQANYVATGAFVLLVLAGIIAAALWVAGAQFNTHYDVYETHIPGSVAGLDSGAPVKVNGIDVGHVSSMEQDVRNPADVNLLLQIRPNATIRSDSVASLQMQGLTGGRYVEITGGTLASPKLSAEPGQRYPTIAARQSSLDALFNDVPQLMKNLKVIADGLQSILDDRNRHSIDQTLASLSDLTTKLDQHSQDLDRMLANGDSTLHNLARASANLDTLLARFQGTPQELDRLIASANLLTDNLNDAVRTSLPGLHELTTTVPARLDALLAMATRLTAS